MSREILFRGKRVDNNQWTEGFLSFIYTDGRNSNGFIYTDKAQIYSPVEVRSHDVYTATVGQFTGLVDRTGKKIFEGDVVEAWSQGVKAQGVVQKRIDGLWIIYPAYQKNIIWGLCPEESGETNVTVIGNIHDNPELVKEEE